MSDSIQTDGSELELPKNPYLWPLIVILLIVLAFCGQMIYTYYRLPPAFMVTKDDVLVNHTNGDMNLAIDVAERTRMPVIATEMGGTRESVSYARARQILRYTDTWRVDVPLFPGDLVDARAGRYVPATQGYYQSMYDG